MSVYDYSTGIKITFDKKITSDPISVVGWVVSALEPDMSPDGTLSLKQYTISKITKTDGDFAIIIWLTLTDRLKYPIGDVTVSFAGSLTGPAGSVVEPFEISFTPTQPAKIFNPNEILFLQLDLAEIVQADVHKIMYASAQTIEDILTELATAEIVSMVLTHIDDLQD